MLDNADKDIRDLKLSMQKNNDLLQGGLRSNNMKNYRNTYIIPARDNLDDTYAMYVYFNIVDEMAKMVSIKLSFWILPYRYSDAGGITEENNSPTIGFQISKDNGATYGAILGKYTADVANLEIKDYISASGSYIIKFTSSARARLSVQLTAKLDITAR